MLQLWLMYTTVQRRKRYDVMCQLSVSKTQTLWLLLLYCGWPGRKVRLRIGTSWKWSPFYLIQGRDHQRQEEAYHILPPIVHA